jgi:hypothetical protein
MILSPLEAAVLLGVDAETIEIWEERFGYPTRCTAGAEWGYAHEDLIALRIGLDTTFSVAQAVARARAPEMPARLQIYG